MLEPLLPLAAALAAIAAIASLVVLPRALAWIRNARADVRGSQAALPAIEVLIESLGERARRLHRKQRAVEAGIGAASAVVAPVARHARAARKGLEAALRSLAQRNGAAPGGPPPTTG